MSVDDTTKCIVLKYTEYKDNSYIIQMYAENHGLISINAKINKRSKIRQAYLYPLARLNCSLAIQPSKSIHSVTECNYAGNLNPQFAPASAMIKIFIAEILSNTLREQTFEPPTFKFIEDSIDFLENNTKNSLNFLIVFLIKYTSFLGFFPNISNFYHNSMFDLVNSNFTKNTPTHNLYLSSEQSLHFANLLRASYQTMHLFTLSRPERYEILNHVMQYYNLHIIDFKEPKSLEIIRTM